MRLALRCVIRNGVRRIWVAESMNDVATDLADRRASRGTRAPRRSWSGSSTASAPSTPTTTTPSARAPSRASPDVDILNLKDPGGLLTPERMRTLVPALREAAPELPLEVHSHMTGDDGRGRPTSRPLSLGASSVCTAARPLANGTSQPSAEQTIANLRRPGLRTSTSTSDALR